MSKQDNSDNQGDKMGKSKEVYYLILETLDTSQQKSIRSPKYSPSASFAQERYYVVFFPMRCNEVIYTLNELL